MVRQNYFILPWPLKFYMTTWQRHLLRFHTEGYCINLVYYVLVQQYSLGSKTFLCDKVQSARVGPQLSTSRQVISGIPQGTLFNQLLFLINLNYFCDMDDNSKNALYADEAEIYKSIKN